MAVRSQYSAVPYNTGRKRSYRRVSDVPLFLDQITVLVLTRNEAPNIGRTLDKLSWAQRVVVVDSFSLDETCSIAHSYQNVMLVQRKFDNHAAQWNYGLAHIDTEWVLSLDADYQLTDSLVDELKTLNPPQAMDAYFARFKYCIRGRPLRATLYPPRAVLFRRACCRYEQEGHTQVLRIDGDCGWLQALIYHDDRKPLTDWLASQDRYARLEAEHLLSSSPAELSLPDRLRRWIVPAPALVLFYALFVKGLIFDGWSGWYYAFQRAVAETVLSLRVIESRLTAPKDADSIRP